MSTFRGGLGPLANVAADEIEYDGALYGNFGGGVYRNCMGRVFEWPGRGVEMPLELWNLSGWGA